MNTHDPVETYFECISHCYIDDEEEKCLSVCVERLKDDQFGTSTIS
jgi:hypothetical protein